MSYQKNSWSDGDIITAGKLNNIENGVESVETNVTQATSDISTLQNRVTALEESPSTPADYQELVDDVSSLKADLDESDVLPIRAYSAQNGYLTTNGTWGNTSGTYKVIFMPVKNGDVVEIQGSSITDTVFAVLTEVPNVVLGETIPFSTVTPWTSRKTIGSTTATYTMPTDAACMAITTINNNRDSMPALLAINGIDKAKTVYENMRNIEAKINDAVINLEEYVDSSIGEPVYAYDTLRITPQSGFYKIDGSFNSSAVHKNVKLPVDVGDIYLLTAAVQASSNHALAVFLNANDELVSYAYRGGSAVQTYIDQSVTVPENAKYLCVNTYTQALNFIRVKKATKQAVYEMAETNAKNHADLFYHKNLINPVNITYDVRYSAGTNNIVSDTNSYIGTGFIEVKEGGMYTFSGTAAYMQGGYFASDANLIPGQTAIATVEFFDPVNGGGKVFTVPTGQNIKYVSLLLKLINGELTGTYQLEEGEVATENVPYNTVTIKQSLLPSGTVGTLAELNDLPMPTYDSKYIDKIASFRNHWAKKDKDLMVVGTGTSLTARGSEHCTLRSDGNARPPLMDSNNFASLMWDRMKWEGQQYRRYDYTGFFTETGTFATSNNLADWDDTNYRNGLTRYASGACSVTYTVPADAWQNNFIYRTDRYGSETVTVSISEGNGKMQVWNGAAWVEANGYSFSMRESPVILPSINVPDPLTYEDNRAVERTNYQVGGNTTFQKRLKMKAIDRTSSKTVTVATESGRFMYWGVEWTPREYMITYVNSARGSHNMNMQYSTGLQHFQDNEIWAFKPDLIFTENPIHNSGGSGQASGFSNYYSAYWQNITFDFFFNANDPVSLVSRAQANGIDPDNLEWIIFNSSIAWNFHGITDDGTLKIEPDKNGRMITALDAQMMSQDYITSTEKAVSINACKYWVDACIKMFGDLRTATEGSGKDGATFTNEGSHWNDTGCKVMDRCVGGVFDFYN